MKTILIESVQPDGTEWGVSFTGSNPEAPDYVACKTKDDALKLHRRIADISRALHLACERIADGDQEYHEANTPEGWADVYLARATQNSEP